MMRWVSPRSNNIDSFEILVLTWQPAALQMLLYQLNFMIIAILYGFIGGSIFFGTIRGEI